MTTPIDSNLLIRHLTGDPPGQAAKATAFLRRAGPNDLVLLDLHAAECVYVLAGPYQQPRQHIVRALRSAMAVPAIEFENESVIDRALDLYLNGVDFPDGYLVARAEAMGVSHVAGFDRFDANLARNSSVRRIEPS